MHAECRNLCPRQGNNLQLASIICRYNSNDVVVFNVSHYMTKNVKQFNTGSSVQLH